MKKVIKLNENDIEGLVKKILKENRVNEHVDNFIDMEFEKVMRKLESENFSSTKLIKIGKNI